MRFSITAALAAFPFLVGAVPVHNSRDNLLSIPLSKRWLSQLSDNDGEVPNIPHNSREFVSPVLFSEKGASLTKLST
jgi:hypothetical protein